MNENNCLKYFINFFKKKTKTASNKNMTIEEKNNYNIDRKLYTIYENDEINYEKSSNLELQKNKKQEKMIKLRKLYDFNEWP